MIENNYGNVGLKTTLGRRTTEPGLARIDFDPNSGQSRIIWENLNIAIPSIVSGLSTQDGLIYTYAKDSKSWYFAAVDYQTGEILAKKRIPRKRILADALANNFYSGLNIGPDGSAYTSILGGIAVWRPKSK